MIRVILMVRLVLSLGKEGQVGKEIAESCFAIVVVPVVIPKCSDDDKDAGSVPSTIVPGCHRQSGGSLRW